MPVDPLHDASQDAEEEAEIAAFEEAGRAAERAKAEAAKASRYQPQSAAEHDGGILGIGLLADIELDATLQFGSCEMPLKEILELGPGDVVELDRHVSEPVDLVVGDLIVARGEVVVASGNFALRITEVATPQLRLESIRCQF